MDINICLSKTERIKARKKHTKLGTKSLEPDVGKERDSFERDRHVLYSTVVQIQCKENSDQSWGEFPARGVKSVT